MELFCLQDAVASWGHEYIRSLSGEIGDEYHARREKEESVQDLLDLVAQIVPFHMTHNAGLMSPEALKFCHACTIVLTYTDSLQRGSYVDMHACLFSTCCSTSGAAGVSCQIWRLASHSAHPQISRSGG